MPQGECIVSTKSKNNGLLALDAQQAEITTAAVTIRTLWVGSKQLTQAVFRQLRIRRLIEDAPADPKPLGTVWGWVNYTPAGEDAELCQLIVQFGDELSRCPIRVENANLRTESLGALLESYRKYGTALVYLRMLRRDKVTVTAWNPWHGYYRDDVSITTPGFLGQREFRVDVNRGLLKKFVGLTDLPSDLPSDGTTDSAREQIGTVVKQICRVDTLPEEAWVTERMMETDATAKCYAIKYNKLMNRLRQAPQLFIAV
jgi:hypothetical protein